jgi:hypothetical protein
MEDAFEAFYQERGQASEMVTRMFLGHPDLEEIAHVLVSAANGSKKAAAGLFDLVSNPSPLVAMRNADDAKAYVSRLTGENSDAILERSRKRVQAADADAAERRPHFRRSAH